MRKKNIPPSLFYPLWRAPWPEFRFRRIIRSRWRQARLFLCVHRFKFPSWTLKVRFFGVWGRHLDTLECRAGVKAREKRERAARRQEKQAKCDCAVESCSPRFTVILGITTLFNNSGRTEEGKKKTCSRLKTHENDREEKNLTIRFSQIWNSGDTLRGCFTWAYRAISSSRENQCAACYLWPWLTQIFSSDGLPGREVFCTCSNV